MNLHRLADALAQRGIRFETSGFDDYLADESRMQGYAYGIVRPRDERDVIATVRAANLFNVHLTVVSGKTSLTGACVPQGGIIVDLRQLNRIDPDDPTVAGPGVVTAHYRRHVESRGCFFPPDPTSEDSCTLGGNTACCASGALSYYYGPIRDYIRGLRVVLGSGAVLDVERGDIVARDGVLVVPGKMLSPEAPHDLVIPVPLLNQPRRRDVKNAAGPFSDPSMDLVDLFVGSEGIFGIVIDVRTILLPRRKPAFALSLYLRNPEVTVELVSLLDNLRRCFHAHETHLLPEVRSAFERLAGGGPPPEISRFEELVPSCMEWLGSSTARFISSDRARPLKQSYGCLYVEQEYPVGADPWDYASLWWELTELFNRRYGSDAPTAAIVTEAAMDEKKMRDLRRDRRSVPERINEAITPGMVKVGTDFSVPMPRLKELLELYDETLRGIDTYAFGHIGNAHLHVNMLPGDEEELEHCRTTYQLLAERICAMEGSVSAEHGIGKLKRKLLEMMIGEVGMLDIARVKRVTDPNGLLNRDTMIPAQR
ncbi:MAG: FAD-binding oxidoreductase [Pseudomonadota bacterium]